ncbi:unnamed protein product [Adineta ricciae]|uniref:Fluoride ion transporter CrcB n=1 Tax=Adineta ricciae TaxID=249248 RepID=A0A813T3Q0_ADIRI|nr:unnamed protein product [Adineta ricciae]CAF0911029.1 unnamed protein product [Adineta ricciae]
MNNQAAIPETLEYVTENETEPVVVQQHRLSSIMPIVVFSYIGVLIRLGLAFLGNNQAPMNAAFWPNFVGCFIMGFVVEQKIHIQHHFSQLYIGLTTGLCGSITTFSGLMYSSCVALFGPSSDLTYPISNFLTVLIAALSASFVGFTVGRHISAFLLPPSPELAKRVRYFNSHVRIWLFPILTLLSIPLLVLLAVLLPVGKYTYFIYSVIFAPFGSLTRYALSVLFNFNSNFPLGTLIANILGSYIYFGMVAISQYVHSLSPLSKHVVTSVIQGYCGCLTTISTFILELDTIKKRKYVYLYFTMSVLLVQLVYVILGDLFSFICSPVS